MKKGQAAIMDALLFMLVSAGASALLIYVSSLYGASTNDQVSAMYNYEYAGNALIALHYAQDNDGKWFWNEVKERLNERPDEVEGYIDDSGVWDSIVDSSPARYTFLCFDSICYSDSIKTEQELEEEGRTVYTSSVAMDRHWTAILKLYY